MVPRLYATAPRTLPAFSDCYFYHSMEIPGFGAVEGEWDLRASTDAYLGFTDFSGKRVLEIGPASGYLSFYMEKQGAQVVSVDVGDEFVFDVFPFAGIDRKALSDWFVATQKKVQNGYWLTHHALKSKNRVHYGSGYKIPSELGDFDIGLMASVLLHNANPIEIINQVARRTRGKLIIADLLHPAGATDNSPTIMLHPTVENKVYHTWWRFSDAFFVEVMKIVGFPNIKINKSKQMYKNIPFELSTIVAERA